MTERLLHDLALMVPETVVTVTIIAALVADIIFRRSRAIVPAIVLVGLTVAGIVVLGQRRGASGKDGGGGASMGGRMGGDMGAPQIDEEEIPF